MMLTGLRGWLWRREARRLLRAKGMQRGAAAAEAAIRWDFAREAREEWGPPWMAPEMVLDMDLESYREPEAVSAWWPPRLRGLSRAEYDVVCERRRQTADEGWSPEHDDEHAEGQLAFAAATYAYIAGESDGDRARILHIGLAGVLYHVRIRWPWAAEWFKPKDRRSDLVRAGALILAEIERLDRAEARDGG